MITADVKTQKSSKLRRSSIFNFTMISGIMLLVLLAFMSSIKDFGTKVSHYFEGAYCTLATPEWVSSLEGEISTLATPEWVSNCEGEPNTLATLQWVSSIRNKKYIWLLCQAQTSAVKLLNELMSIMTLYVRIVLTLFDCNYCYHITFIDIPLKCHLIKLKLIQNMLTRHDF
jgi:hypothetical protein